MDESVRKRKKFSRNKFVIDREKIDKLKLLQTKNGKYSA